MPRFDFLYIDVLWNLIEQKCESSNLDLIGNELIEKTDLTPQDIARVNEKFLGIRLNQPIPEFVNLSNRVISELCSYVNISSLEELSDKYQKRIDQQFDVIEFVGRERELDEISRFITDEEKTILCVYGVPLIGKSSLVNHYIENRLSSEEFEVSIINLDAPPSNCEEVIFEVFTQLEPTDKKRVIVIENFEECLDWHGDISNLHKIKNSYPRINKLLKDLISKSNDKIIIESRFQINFKDITTSPRDINILLNGELQGVETDHLWRFYETKGFSKDDFETLCENFENHTGLLATAHNDREWLYDNNLLNAITDPHATTKFVWSFVERTLSRLSSEEIDTLIHLLNGNNDLPQPHPSSIEISFSLRKKFFVHTLKGEFYLNPYVKEICWTFLELNHPRNIREFKRRNSLSTVNMPSYDKIRQAREKGDYGLFYRLIKKERDRRNFEYINEILKETLSVDNVIKKTGVLNEIAITFKHQRKWGEAITALERALQIKSTDTKTLNELIICYRENGNMDKAIETAKKAISLGSNESRTELAICYRVNNQLEKSIEVAKEAVEKNIGKAKVPALSELGISYREHRKIEDSVKTFETILGINSSDSMAMNELAISLRDLGNYEEAISYAKKSIDLKNYRSYTVLSTIYEQQGNIEEAFKVSAKGMKTYGWDKSRITRQHKKMESLMTTLKKTEPKKVFISYSHKDEEIKNRLITSLSTLTRTNKIVLWHDEDIESGQEWNDEIFKNFRSADIIILLISPDFIASDFCYSKELKEAIERHNEKKAKVIPVIARPTDWHELEFSKIKALPKDGKPITDWSNLDNAYLNVVNGLKKVVK